MTIRQIIGRREAGEVIPQAYAEALMKDSTSTSIMVAVNGELFEIKKDEPLTAQQFLDLLADDELKDHTLGFCISKGGKLSVESLQPFFIRRHDNVPISAVMLGGPLMVSMPPNSSHTQSYHTWQKISVKLNRLYNSASDMKAYRAAIMGDEFKDDMDMYLGNEGAMIILHADGSFDDCGQCIRGADFSWGIVSDALGHKEKPKAREEAPAKKQGLLAKLGSKLTGGEPEPEKKVEEPKPISDPPKADPVVSPSPAETAVVPAGSIAFEMYTPRKGLKRPKDLNKVLNDKLGCVPLGAWETYEQGGSFPVPVGTAIKISRTDHYEIFREECAKAKVKYVPIDVLTKVPPQPPKEVEPPKGNEQNVSGVVSAQGKKHFNEVFLKRPSVMMAIAESRQEVVHPKFLPRLDNKASTSFADQSGMKQGVLDTLGWSEEDIRAFLKDEDPRLVFLWARDMSLELLSTKLAMKKMQDTAPPKKQGMLAGLSKAS